MAVVREASLHSGLVFFRCTLQPIIRCELRAPRLSELKRKPAVCIEHHNAFWIRAKPLESATIRPDVVCRRDKPTSNKLVLKRFFLRNCESCLEHKSQRRQCGNTENDTPIHGLSSGLSPAN